MRAAAIALAAVLATAGPLAGQEARSPAGPTIALDMPGIAGGLAAAMALYRAGRLDDAAGRLEALVARHPDRADPRIALAVIDLARGDPEAALDRIEAAVEGGYRGMETLARSSAFRTLVGHPRFAALREATAGERAAPDPVLAEPEPAIASVEELTAPVGPANTVWNPDRGRVSALVRVPPVLARRPVLPETGRLAALAPTLNRLYARGRAAGLAGVLYDNRDRDHSTLRRAAFPQLLHVEYDAAARERGLDYGPNRDLDFGRITFGNSSTALTGGPFWRSQARRLLTEPDGPDRLFQSYSRNQIYVYPEKSDHGDRGADLMPANTPYQIVSQGASGSDRPFLEAVAVILAAMPPPARDRLEAEGLVAPAVQMILRRGAVGIETREDYLSARAHPSVFAAASLDPGRLLRLAQTLDPATLPPMVRLTVLHEAPGQPSFLFGPGLSEALFDTPSAIARVFRGTAATRRMVVSARTTRDPNGRPLTFHWRVLRGDAARILLTPRADDWSVVEIEMPWHDAFPVPGRPDLTTTRVDIAVFADNGATLSAPAFVSWLFPPDQTRRYGPRGQVMEIDYAPDGDRPYADPLIFPRRDWLDVYAYGPDGAMIGWTRHRPGESVRYDAEGRRIGADGVARPVAYRAGGRGPDGRVEVVVEPVEGATAAEAPE